MSDTIGRGIIEVVADPSNLTAGMEDAKRAVERFEQAAVESAGRAGGALAKTGDGAGAAADKLDAATRRYINSVEREIAAISLSRTEYRLWEGQVKGISSSVYEPLVERLLAAKNAQDANAKAALEAAAAERQAAEAAKEVARAQREAEQARASQDAFLNNIREQIALMGKNTEEVLRYKAAQMGVGAAAEPLIQQLQAQRAAQEAVTQAAKEQAQAQRDAAQASREADQQRASQAQFLTGLREQIALQGKSAEEALRFRAAQAGVAQEAAPLIVQLENIKAAQKAAADAAREEAQAQREAAQAAASRTSFIDQLRTQAESIGKSRSQILELQAAQLGLTQQAAPFIARLREAEQNIGRVGLSAKETALALRGVPAQLTDIIVSLQGGQAPLTVFLQQGGQLRDMFGSAKDAAVALGGAIARLLVNPLVLGAAAVLALAAAYNRGSKETDAFNAALISTGNATGTTRDALAARARDIDAVVGTQAQAAEALAALVATGRVAAGNLTDLATTAIRVQRTTGVAVGETVKQFAELGKDPVEASKRLNEETNFLTLAVYEQIKALQEAGRTTEAAALAQRTYAEELDRRTGRITENLGFIERGWRAVKDATLEAVDAALRVGRTQGPSEQLAALQAEQQRRQQPFLQRLLTPRTGLGVGANLSDSELRDQIDLLQAGQREASRFAAAQAQGVEAQRRGIEASAEVDAILKRSLTKQQQMNDALEKYRRNLAAIRAANPDDKRLDPKRIAEGEANIREQFKERAGRKPREYQDDAGTRLLLQLRQQEQALREQLSTEEKVGAAAKARIEFEQLLADLKDKRTLTAEQKSLVANQAAILAQLRKNELIEDEVKVVEERIKIEKQAERERLQFIQRTQQIEETIAQQRESRREQFDRAFGTLGQGEFTRRQVEEQRGIYRESERLQAQLVKATPTGLLGSPEYEAAAQKIRDALQQALADQEDYYKRLRVAQADWSVGASEALNNYLDSVRDVAGQTQRLFENAFEGITDVSTEFLRTGRADIKAFADSIQKDVTTMVVRQQISGPLAQLIQGGMTSGTGVGGFIGRGLQGLFGGGNGTPATSGASGTAMALLATTTTGASTALGLFTTALTTAITALTSTTGASAATSAVSSVGGGGGGFFSFISSLFGGAPGRAVGGPTFPGRLYQVGEDGPELMRWRNRNYLLMGREGGQVTPAGARSGGDRRMSVINNFHFSGPVDRRTQQQLGATAARSLATANTRNN